MTPAEVAKALHAVFLVLFSSRVVHDDLRQWLARFHPLVYDLVQSVGLIVLIGAIGLCVRERLRRTRKKVRND